MRRVPFALAPNWSLVSLSFSAVDLGAFADEFEESVSIPYAEIPGFVSSTAEGHVGRLVVGKVGQVPVLAMQGRVHSTRATLWRK